MLGEEVPSAEGVLKMNCKVLDSSQLKKLDKQEKILAQEIHYTGKGKLFLSYFNVFNLNKYLIPFKIQEDRH